MQSAINMHLSQISHGKLGVYSQEGTDPMFLTDDDNTIVVGYAPSMIKLLVMDDSGVLQHVGCWYDWLPGTVFTGDAVLGMATSYVTTNERGFVIDGAALVELEATAAMIVWETYGCENKNDYQDEMNPDAVAADGAMDAVPGWEPLLVHGEEADESS